MADHFADAQLTVTPALAAGAVNTSIASATLTLTPTMGSATTNRRRAYAQTLKIKPTLVGTALNVSSAHAHLTLSPVIEARARTNLRGTDHRFTPTMGSGTITALLTGAGSQFPAQTYIGWKVGVTDAPIAYVGHKLTLSGALLPAPATGKSLLFGYADARAETWASGSLQLTTVEVPDDSSLPPAPGEPAREGSPAVKALKGISLLMSDTPWGSEPAPYDYSPWPVEQDPFLPANLGVDGDPGEDFEPIEPPEDADPTLPPPGPGEAPGGLYLATGYFKVIFKSGGPTSTAEGYQGAVAVGIKDLAAKFNPILVDGKYFLRNFQQGYIHWTPNDVAKESTGHQWWVHVEAKYSVMDSTGAPVSPPLHLTTCWYEIMKPRNGAWRSVSLDGAIFPLPFKWNECQHVRATVQGWQITIGCEDFATITWPIMPLSAAPAQSPYVP